MDQTPILCYHAAAFFLNCRRCGIPTCQACPEKVHTVRIPFLNIALPFVICEACSAALADMAPNLDRRMLPLQNLCVVSAAVDRLKNEFIYGEGFRCLSVVGTATQAMVAVPKAAISSLIGANVGAITGMVAGAMGGAALGAAVSNDVSVGSTATMRSIVDGTSTLISNVKALSNLRSTGSSGFAQQNLPLLRDSNAESSSGKTDMSEVSTGNRRIAVESTPVIESHSPTVGPCQTSAQVEHERLLQAQRDFEAEIASQPDESRVAREGSPVHARALLRLCFTVLDVPQGAPIDVAKAAHRKHMRTLHPDKNPSPEASAVSQALNAAIEVVGSAEVRTRTEILANQAPPLPHFDGGGTTASRSAASPSFAASALGTTLKVLSIGGIVASTLVGLGLGTALGIATGAAAGSIGHFSSSMTSSYNYCSTVVPAQVVWLEALELALNEAHKRAEKAILADSATDGMQGCGAGLPGLSVEWLPQKQISTVVDVVPSLLRDVQITVLPFYDPDVAAAIVQSHVPPRVSSRGAMGPTGFAALASIQYAELLADKRAALGGPMTEDVLGEIWTDLQLRLKEGLDDADLQWMENMMRDMPHKWLEIVSQPHGASSALTLASLMGQVGPSVASLRLWTSLWETYAMTQQLTAQIASASRWGGGTVTESTSKIATAEATAAKSPALVPDLRVWRTALLRASIVRTNIDKLQPLHFRIEAAVEHTLTQTIKFPPPYEQTSSVNVPGPTPQPANDSENVSMPVPSKVGNTSDETWLSTLAGLMSSLRSAVGIPSATACPHNVIGPGMDVREVGRGVSRWRSEASAVGMVANYDCDLRVAGRVLASARDEACDIAHAAAKSQYTDLSLLPTGSDVFLTESTVLLFRLVATELPNAAGSMVLGETRTSLAALIPCRADVVKMQLSLTTGT